MYFDQENSNETWSFKNIGHNHMTINLSTKILHHGVNYASKVTLIHGMAELMVYARNINRNECVD